MIIYSRTNHSSIKLSVNKLHMEDGYGIQVIPQPLKYHGKYNLEIFYLISLNGIKDLLEYLYYNQEYIESLSYSLPRKDSLVNYSLIICFIKLYTEDRDLLIVYRLQLLYKDNHLYNIHTKDKILQVFSLCRRYDI